jgi:alpha-tubulin suppressor-like RCC1 family protein
MKMIAAGAEHTAAVTEDSDLYGWGWGRYGNLGLGDRNDRLLPKKVSSVEVNYLIWPGLSFFSSLESTDPSI